MTGERVRGPRQRESNLAGDGFVNLPLEASSDWHMAGHGAFRRVGPDTVESEGGPGIWWYLSNSSLQLSIINDHCSPPDRSEIPLGSPETTA